MDGKKRHRVELDSTSYEALRYFGLLRGVPIGRVMSQALTAFASQVSADFPPVRAHVLAIRAAAEAAEPDSRVPDDVPF